MSSGRKIIDFQIIDSPSLYYCSQYTGISPASEITRKVSQKIKLGYEPYGPITAAMFGDTYQLLQTVVKYENTQNVNSDEPPRYNEVAHRPSNISNVSI